MTHLVLSSRKEIESTEKNELRADDFLPPLGKPPFIFASKNSHIIQQFAERGPEYLDIPHDEEELLLHIRKQYPEQKIILSYHDYEKTPEDIEALYARLRKLPCDAIKIVTMAQSSLDGLRMLKFLREKSADFPITAFCMGEKGSFSRILQPVYGGFSSYCCLEGESTAQGQLTAKEMIDIYRFKTLTQNTIPYALIGKPVSGSFGHILHNALFEKIPHDAVYVKIELEAHECHEALQLFTDLYFQGLSITMPLKQAFFEKPYNTAVRKGQKWHFFNTDGSGALDFLGNVHGKSMLIYGAGGTAEAIGEEALKFGASVFFCNRTHEKAVMLAQKIGARAVEKPIQTDLIVNATPFPIEGRISLNVNSKSPTGEMMWLHQAAKQQALFRAFHHPLKLPASKSQTLRACLFASLAAGRSHIYNPLASPDTKAMIAACRAIGAKIEEQDECLIIDGIGKRRTLDSSLIDAGNSGIVLRFMAAVGALFSEPVTLVGDASMQSRRSCSALIQGLQELGGSVHSQAGHAPLTITGPIHAGSICLNGEDSQPISALLIAASLLQGSTTIVVKNGGERPWIELTLDWLRRQYVKIEEPTPWTFIVHPVETFAPFEYRVPGDLSSLSYLTVAALFSPGTTVIRDVDLNDLQGDKKLLQILKTMGAHFTIEGTTLTINGPQILHGIDININSCIDMVTILAVVGCFAKGVTRIRGASIARDKESNRLQAMTLELQKMGAAIEETEDGLMIQESKLQGASLHSHHDHRVAMALSVAALFATGPSTISDLECVKKTYNNFFYDLERFT